MYNLLVVEDDLQLVEAYKDRLGPKYNLKVAVTGQQAIDVLSSWSPDIVILDIYFQGEGIDGFEILRRIREDDNTRNLPVVVVTNLPDIEKKSLELGASKVLMKANTSLIDIENTLQQLLHQP